MGCGILGTVQFAWDTVGLVLKVPTATYRVQLNKNFTFQDLKAVVPYLSQLGVSHIYASPIFKARTGSLHGYDIVDPNIISEELGGRAGFEEVAREAQAYNLHWLQDIVPNHAAYSPQNKKISDVLTKGAESSYACFFDVDWNHPTPLLQGKIFTPFLSERFCESLRYKKISLIHTGSDFKVQYGELEFPLSPKTQQRLELDDSIQVTLDKYNSNPKLLYQLLDNQHYQLGYWRESLKHINYRRFFDILDLIGLRMETPIVFEQMQQLIFELTRSGLFSGLRVDHIDGLCEPNEYLHMLRQHCPEAYIIVEKILTGEEQLPTHWPVEGSTGYDFLNHLNKLFIQASNMSPLDTLYRVFTGDTRSYSSILSEAKKVAVENYFQGDMKNLAWLFNDTLSKLGYMVPYSRDRLVLAVTQVMVCFPFYRTYLDGKCEDDKIWWATLWLAEQLNPALAAELLAISHLIQQSKTQPAALAVIKRFQQYTGAVMAKGFEDTLLYRYNRLLSLNEVGSAPNQFGISIEQFHQFNLVRQHKWPLTINASSTHDTKRGEDVRARLNVLSEFPDEFRLNVEAWTKLNTAKKKQINGMPAPDGNEEYYLYHTLLGAYPWNPFDQQDFSSRIKNHMNKVLQEAKNHSTWLHQNHTYHQALEAFIEHVLSNHAFLDAFLPFQQKIAYLGVYNSLSQTMLKIGCPGIPDFYGGTELWDLNLVDPDNRRPVDFKLRQKMLVEVSQIKPQSTSVLLQTPNDAKAKMYLITKALRFRRENSALFEKGAYLQLAAKGKYAENVVAFCRVKSCLYLLVVVPRLPAGLLCIDKRDVNQRVPNMSAWGEVDWIDTHLQLPEAAPTQFTDVFTEQTLLSSDGRLFLNDVLGTFPVAMLWGDAGV